MILSTPNGISVYSTLHGACLRISWQPVEYATSYKLYRSEIPWGDFSLLATLTSNVGMTYFDTPRTPNDNINNHWYYEVSANDGSSVSVMSGPHTTLNYSAFDVKPIPGTSWTNLF